MITEVSWQRGDARSKQDTNKELQQQHEELQQQALTSRGVPSIYRVARELRREANGLYNCLCSVWADAAFVREIAVLYPGLPLLANLRCGLWYAPPAALAGTCYFKSTDGHANGPGFSSTRLNWHVAELAARRGGVAIVDATRKGKRFPDAMTRTIPIWAAVINRAVARVRNHDALKAQRRRCYTSLNGDVITPVADTQTSISVRDELCSTHPPSQEEEKQDAPPAAGRGGVASCSSLCSNNSTAGVEAVLLECMGPASMQLMSAGVARPATPDLETPLQPSWQHAGAFATPSSIPQLARDCSSGGVPELTMRTSTSGAVARPGLQRSRSLQLSPQPSLQEWLDEDEAYRRAALLLLPGSSVMSWYGSTSTKLQHNSSVRASRPPRVSCHTIGAAPQTAAAAAAAATAATTAAQGSDTWCQEQPAWHGPPRLMRASSAPASSCLLLLAGEDAQEVPHCDDAVASAAPLWLPAVTTQRQEGPSLAGTSCAAEPVTPRLGTCPAWLPWSLNSVIDALGEEGATSSRPCQPAVCGEATRVPLPCAAAAGAVSHSTGTGVGLKHEQHVQQQQQQQQQQQRYVPIADPDDDAWAGIDCKVASSGPPTVASSVTIACADGVSPSSSSLLIGEFAFPPPHLLAQSMCSSLLCASDAALHGSSSAHAEPCSRSGASSCAAGVASTTAGDGGDFEDDHDAAGVLVAPTMPVVVLNGTSHQPSDAASILDMWRATELEELAALPKLADFVPGVLHLPEQQEQQGQQQQQQEYADEYVLAERGTFGSRKTSSTGCLVDRECAPCGPLLAQREAAAAGAAAAATGIWPPAPGSVSSAGSSTGWLEDDLGDAGQGLGALGPAPAAPAPAGNSGAGSAPGSIAGGGPQSIDGRSSDSCKSLAALGQSWDTELHLPLWVGDSERAALEAKVDGWVERLLEMGADVRGLAARLHKPLRPLWLSQDSMIWTNQVAQPSSLPFTPLLLVSASQPHCCERQALRAPWQPSDRQVVSGALVDDMSQNGHAPVRLASDSDDDGAVHHQQRSPCGGPRARAKYARHAAAGERGGGASHGGQQQLAHDAAAPASPAVWSYSYLPGAGDDEESWAAGLTPSLFWDNAPQLLASGPAGVRDAVHRLIARHKGTTIALSSCSAGINQGGGGGGLFAPLSVGRQPLLQQHQQQGMGNGQTGCNLMLQEETLQWTAAAPRGRHQLAPRGCFGAAGVPAELGAAGLCVQPAAPGAYWLGSTGLAVGSLEGASAADVWHAVDAVLCLGTELPCMLQQEHRALAAQLLASAVPDVVAHTACDGAANLLPPHGSDPVDTPGISAPGGCSGVPSVAISNTPSSSSTSSSIPQTRSCVVVPGEAPPSAPALQPGETPADAPSVVVPGDQVVAASPRRRGSSMLSELLRRSVNGSGGGGGSSISPASTAGDATGAGAVASPTADAVDGRPGHSRSASAGSCGSSTGTCDAAVCSSIASSVESACSGVSSSYYSTCSDDAPAGAAAAAAAAARPPLLRDAAGRLLPRLRWLPVLSCKRDRGSLAAALDDALEFVGAHLAAGRSVLLQDCGGHDSCVCVAVAVLLACFTPPGVQSAGAQQLSGPTFVGPWPPSDVSGGLSVTLPPEPVTKQSMRQRLAFVSSCYPIARPARGGLKQVYNYFVSAAAASGVHATVAAEVGYRRRRLGRQGTQALQQQQQEPELPADDSDRE